MKSFNVELTERNLDDVKSILTDCFCGSMRLSNRYYKHRTPYDKAPSVIENGILTLKDIRQMQGQPLTIENLSDEDYHVVCLSKDVDEHKLNSRDLDEAIFDNSLPEYVYFTVDNNIKVRQESEPLYVNEYIHKGRIEPSLLISADVKLFALMDDTKNKLSIEDLIKKYNYLKIIAQTIKDNNSNIRIRETSNNETELSVDKIINAPSLVLRGRSDVYSK